MAAIFVTRLNYKQLINRIVIQVICFYNEYTAKKMNKLVIRQMTVMDMIKINQKKYYTLYDHLFKVQKQVDPIYNAQWM